MLKPMTHLNDSRKHLIWGFLVLAALGVTPTPASADLIVQAHSFDVIGVDAIGVQPFDPALGTLDRVVVDIQGVLVVSGTASSSTVSAVVSQDFFGLVGKYFDFVPPAQLLLQGSAIPAQPVNLATSFRYTFEFNQVTDVIGLAALTTLQGPFIVVPSIVGTRADFLVTPLPLDEIDVVQTVGASGILSPLARSQGSLIITYEFTPVPPPAAIPEPATMAVFGVLAAGVFGLRRRRLARA